jgi:hypothetical protein
LSSVADYGSVTERTLPPNVAPVHVPEYFSATPAPSAPALLVNETVKVADAPAERVPVPPSACGSGVPEAEPSVTEVKVKPFTVPVPVFFTVMVKV